MLSDLTKFSFRWMREKGLEHRPWLLKVCFPKHYITLPFNGYNRKNYLLLIVEIK